MTKQKDSAEKAIRDIRRVTRRQYSAEEKIRSCTITRSGAWCYCTEYGVFTQPLPTAANQ